MKHKFYLSVFTIIISTFFVPPLQAAESIQDRNNYLSGYLSLGAFVLPDYEGSDDFQAVPLVAGKINYKHYYFESRGLGGRFNVSPAENFDFGPAFSYQMARDDDVENNEVARLAEVDSAFMAGAFAKIKTNGLMNPYDQLSFDLDALADITDSHDGYLVSFGPSYSYPVSRVLRFSTSLSTTYASENYMDTYFGVNANNAVRSGLNRFDADSSFKDVGLNFVTNYAFNEKWGVIGLIGYKRLIGDAADSPLVDDEGSANQFMVGTGVTYRF